MTHCLCFEPSSRMEWADIGMADGYWDIASMRWGICGTQRLRAFQEIEASSRSGTIEQRRPMRSLPASRQRLRYASSK